MLMGEKIRYYRRMLDLTQEELGERMTPQVGRSAINKWESGKIENIKRSQIIELCKIFHVSASDLLCLDSDDVPTDSVSIPLLGSVAAGLPITAIENRIGTVEVSRELMRGGVELFALKVKGESMTPRLYDGDTVIVRHQADAENGQIVVAMINNTDAVVKKLIKYEDSVALVSLNPEYAPMYFNDDSVIILGVVIEMRCTL